MQGGGDALSVHLQAQFFFFSVIRNWTLFEQYQ